PLRNRAYKWFVPREVYPNDTYPPYCGGPGYTLPVINMEDAFVGICLHALGVPVTEPPPGTFAMYRLEYERCRFSRLV
ncbi:B3GT1 galactosyltransferase, partial [Chloropsis cyanopogon]|nr:B3GT1 galactosyltransferase [Chloropsis cyanopogon]